MASASAAAEPQTSHARSIADLGGTSGCMARILKRRLSTSQAAIVGSPLLAYENQAVLNEDQREQELRAQLRLAQNFVQALKESGVSAKSIADACNITEQAVSNWKSTGKIKTHFLPVISKLTGWPVLRLLTGEQESVPRRPRATTGKVDFEAKDVTDSEWALLEDLRVLPEEEMAALRDRAARNRAHVDQVIARRQEAARGAVQGETKERKAK